MTSFSLITHTNYLDNKYVLGPADSLSNYLSSKKYKVQLISLSFSEFKINKVFRDGKETLSKISYLQIFKYINDLNFLKNNIDESDVYIAIDPISFFSVYFLKKKKVILYLVDYSEVRSKNHIINFIYQCAIRYSVKKSIVVMSAAEKIFNTLNIPAEKRIFLPNYPLINRPVNTKNYKKINSVLPFTDINKINFKLVIDAIADTKNKLNYIENFSLDFIGIKKHETELENYIQEKKVSGIVNYLCINEKQIYNEKLKSYNLGFDINLIKYSYNKYRDPIKIREYIFYEIPVITTKNNAIYNEIEKSKLGIVLEKESELFQLVYSLVLGEVNLKIFQNNMKNYFDFDIDTVLRRLEMIDSI